MIAPFQAVLELLRLGHLTRKYSKGDQQIKAIDDVTLSVERGIILSIVGRSGSGKSTLLNLIGGLDTPTGGEIIFKGNDISRLSSGELAEHRRKSVGMIFQSFNLIHSYNAFENVLLALIFGGGTRKNRKSRALSLLESVGLKDRAYHKPDELSGGETQRVAIARALANDPAVLLADEPTGNLDSATSDEIMELLTGLNHNGNKSIIMVTHDLGLAERISHRVIRLLDGKVIEDYKTRAS